MAVKIITYIQHLAVHCTTQFLYYMLYPFHPDKKYKLKREKKAMNPLNFNFGCVSPARTLCTSEDKGLITMQIRVPLGRDVS